MLKLTIFYTSLKSIELSVDIILNISFVQLKVWLAQNCHPTGHTVLSKSDLSTTFFHKLVEFTFAPLGLQLRSSVANLLRVQVFPVQLSTSCHSYLYYLYNFSELDLIVPADLQHNLFTLNHFKPENLFSLISSSWRIMYL